MSHVYMAHKLIGITYWEINLIPKLPQEANSFRIQFASCFYTPGKLPTKKQQAAISIAPRIPDILGAIALPFTCYTSEPFSYFLMIFFGSALIDLFVGSLGMSKKSDLRKASNKLGLSPWWLRIFGFLTILCSIGHLLKNTGWIIK
ncbi:MAG: hypothetical protein ACTSW7_01040 [Candidatus Thorarchaeota archaeon]